MAWRRIPTKSPDRAIQKKRSKLTLNRNRLADRYPARAQTVRELKGILKRRGIKIEAGTLDKPGLLDHFADDNETTNCAICLDDFTTGDELVRAGP